MRYRRLPDVLPPADSAEWKLRLPRIMGEFAQAHGVSERNLIVAHPSETSLIRFIESIHNDEFAESYDADGNPIPLPRAWRWEVDLHVFWFMQPPPPMTAQKLRAYIEQHSFPS